MAIRRSSATARNVAPTPMPSATLDSSHTRLSTVKSRSADGSDCTVFSHLPSFFFIVRRLNRGQRPYQLRSELVQLPRMVQRESFERPQSLRRQLQQDATAVV